METKDRIQRLSKSRFEDVVSILEVDAEIPKPIATVVNRAMELNPTERYQSPGEMLIDLRAAMQRMNEPLSVPAAAEGDAAAKSSAPPAAPTHTLMFVEANIGMQDIFRQRLKSHGYRVLVLADPERALSRFDSGTKAADCVIFSTGDLGRSA